MPDFSELVAIEPHRFGQWRVLARNHHDDEHWTIAQIVRKGGEASARAWACWWDGMIKAHGLEAAEEALDEELKRVEAFANRWGVPTTPSTRPDLEHDPDTCTCNNGPAPCVDCRALFDARRAMLAAELRKAEPDEQGEG